MATLIQPKTQEELKLCSDGAILRHKSGTAYVVIGHDSNGFPIAARTVLATNPQEWEICEISR